MVYKHCLRYLFFSFFTFNLLAQSELVIPKDAVTVLSINNLNVLKKFSLDELVQYEFMAEVQSEMFDGSTTGKTLKDAGIDFDQRINIFYGKDFIQEIAGFSFGINDRTKLFKVFDDFDIVTSKNKSYSLFRNNSNWLVVKENVALVFKIDATYEHISKITDSIWLARGNGYFYDDDYYNYDEEVNEAPEVYEEGEFYEEEPVEEPVENDVINKTYWELKDSVTVSIQEGLVQALIQQIFDENINLTVSDKNFSDLLLHKSDGVFYVDNSRNFNNAKGLGYFKRMFPELFNNLKDLYTGNVITGDINLNESAINIDFQANYGEGLGSIYEALTSTKFNKTALKYIPNSASGFFTYNIDLKKGYDRAYDVIVPILEKEKNPQISGNLLLFELFNDYINTDAIFDTYQGSMFGSFNGIKKVKTKRIEFIYDENTFEYSENEIEGEEEMPLFTLGFSTERADIPGKILKYFSRMTSRFENKGDYWEIEDAIFNSVPMFIINKNGIILFTNDEDLAKNHSNGYGSLALKGDRAKKAKKSKFMYAHFDWGQAIDKFPREFFSRKQNETLDALRGKTGEIQLTSSKTTNNKTSFAMSYLYDGTYENSGKYLLDIINTLYVLSK